MAFKFIGRLGVILTSDTADDAQHTVSLGPIGSNSSIRVSAVSYTHLTLPTILLV